MRTGTATIRGPSTKDEKAKWDALVRHKAEFEAELADLQTMLRKPRCRHREILLQEVERTKKVLAILGRTGF